MKGILQGYSREQEITLFLIQDLHNGRWSCAVVSEEDKQVDTRAEFLVTVLHEPTNVYMNPQAGTVVKYQVNKEIESRLDIQNISPKPVITWTMEGQAIEAATFITTKVQENYQDMQVTENIKFLFHENFDGKNLEYRVELEVVDEFG